MGSARTESFCKVNLFLRVTGRRADGYHTLETVFFPLGFPSDTLEVDFDAAPGIALETDFPGVPAGAENLVCRAAARYAATANLTPNWRFGLNKRVPVAAGLGGGSADAAAALRLLEEHFGALGKEELSRIAAELGADVPFFLDPRPALAHGVGEELESVTVAEGLPLVLVDTGFPVSAKWAYRRFDLDGAEASDASCELLLAGLARGDWALAARNVRNDLAGALWRKFPVLTRIADELAARGSLAVEVSGSGPTLFAVMPSAVLARRAAESMSERFPQWRSFAAEGR
jgi:4-diphosphocytidyl-2-C-methyl-D-erythritol kinase